MERITEILGQLLGDREIKSVRYSEFTIWVDTTDGETWSLQFCHAEPGQSTWLAD